jgi:hypothetical protein
MFDAASWSTLRALISNAFPLRLGLAKTQAMLTTPHPARKRAVNFFADGAGRQGTGTTDETLIIGYWAGDGQFGPARSGGTSMPACAQPSDRADQSASSSTLSWSSRTSMYIRGLRITKRR